MENKFAEFRQTVRYMPITADESSEFSSIRGKAFPQHTKSALCSRVAACNFCLACLHTAEYVYLCRLVHAKSSLGFVA